MSKTSDRPTLFLLDAYALIYRAYFAMISRPLTTSSGENTSAPYGIARFLMRLLEDHAPDYLGAVFDAGDSFRTELYADYKATREKMPDELRASLPRIRDILEGFGVPVIESDGWEADDVIGTLTAGAGETGMRSVIVSGDKDFYQLLDDNTSLLNPGRGGRTVIEEEMVTLDNAERRLGVPPEHVTDYLALLGDSSDNVPGVRGIGAKTAPGLIERFGDLEGILSGAEKISSARVRNALRDGAEDARLSKRLVTIRRDVPIELDLDRLRRREPDTGRLRDIFRELEFHNLERELMPARTPAPEKLRYHLVDSLEAATAAAASLAAGDALGLTALLDHAGAGWPVLVGIGLSAEPGVAFYLPFGHRAPEVARDADGNPTLAFDSHDVFNLPGLDDPALAPLRELFESEIPKRGENLKAIRSALSLYAVELKALEFDTSIASYCLDPGRRDHGIERLSAERLGQELPPLSEVTGVGRARTPREQLEPEAVSRLVGARADAALRLAEPLRDELAERHAEKLFDTVEIPLVPVLGDMERAGIAIDLDFFSALGEQLNRQLGLVREEIHSIAGEEVNLRSVPQLRELLFEKLALPVLKRTKTGPSTDESVLEELATMGHEIARLILEHRELDKLDGTYVSKLPQLVHPDTGRIHGQFHQTIATTGRLTSSDPNLQNIPVRSELGRQIRKGFVPAEGHQLVAADYSQIELRVLAHLSGDEAFVEAFREGRDIHRETAARIFGLTPELVTSQMRDRAKTINFATIYGQGPVALAAQLATTREEAQTFIEQYFERFSGVASYLETMKDQARRLGFVETLLGRRRYIPEIRSRNPGIRGFGERTATNSPIQGTAADLIKSAMIELHERLSGEPARLILQVHDELLFEVADAAVERVSDVVREEMEGALELDVPLAVDIGAGASWYDAKP